MAEQGVSRTVEPVSALPGSCGTTVADHLHIAKVPLCLLVACSALFGFFLAPAPHSAAGALCLFAGVLLLACGAATLNSAQEHRADRLLLRTRERPLVRGSVPVSRALLQARLLLAAGFAVLFAAFSSAGPPAAGAVAVLLYNYIYTPLKFRSCWALVPGSLCGALPPIIGWLAADGPTLSPLILAAAVLLVTWQIPHFGLVILVNRRDYLSSALPSLIKRFPEAFLRRAVLAWICALVAVTHILLLLLPGLPSVCTWLVGALGLIVIAAALMSLGFRCGVPAYRPLFLLLNGFLALVMLIVALGRVVG